MSPIHKIHGSHLWIHRPVSNRFEYIVPTNLTPSLNFPSFRSATPHMSPAMRDLTSAGPTRLTPWWFEPRTNDFDFDNLIDSEISSTVRKVLHFSFFSCKLVNCASDFVNKLLNYICCQTPENETLYEKRAS